jgi:hypothetical protein
MFWWRICLDAELLEFTVQLPRKLVCLVYAARNRLGSIPKTRFMTVISHVDPSRSMRRQLAQSYWWVGQNGLGDGGAQKPYRHRNVNRRFAHALPARNFREDFI